MRFSLQANSDSDQSISDAEDFEACDCASSVEKPEKERGLLVQSRLEVLIGAAEVSNDGNLVSGLINEKNVGLPVNDEVEMPDFCDEGGIGFSQRGEAVRALDNDVITDDEDSCVLKMGSIASHGKKFQGEIDCHSFASIRKSVARTMPTIGKTIETLIHENGHALQSHSAQPKAKKANKGSKFKVKPRFSLHLQPDSLGMCRPFMFEEEAALSSKVQDFHETSESPALGFLEIPNPNPLESLHGGSQNQGHIVLGEVEAPGKMVIENSMTELLHGLQDKSLQLSEKYKMHARSTTKVEQLVLKRNRSLYGDRVAKYEEQHEPVASGSSDDESNYQKMEQCNLEKKWQTIADRFDEALANSTLSEGETFSTALKPSSVGLLGKLQQVMQNEKLKDVDFVRKLRIGFSPNDEQRSFVVEILSRHLEAKLTVCHCSFVKNLELQALKQPQSSQTWTYEEMERMIIFSPRVCSDVDLDTGNWIRIHFPWKEVQVPGDGRSIILATYFSCCSF